MSIMRYQMEGYTFDIVADGKGTYTLTEHHPDGSEEVYEDLEYSDAQDELLDNFKSFYDRPRVQKLNNCTVWIWEHCKTLSEYVAALCRCGFTYAEVEHELSIECGLPDSDVQDLLTHVYEPCRKKFMCELNC